MITTDPKKAAEISAAIGRSLEGYADVRADPAAIRQAFADRRLLAAELGRVLMSLTELLAEVQGLRRALQAEGKEEEDSDQEWLHGGKLGDGETDDARMATPEEQAETEQRYGKSTEELAEEAERGYDLTDAVVRGPRDPEEELAKIQISKESSDYHLGLAIETIRTLQGRFERLAEEFELVLDGFSQEAYPAGISDELPGPHAATVRMVEVETLRTWVPHIRGMATMTEDQVERDHPGA